MQKFITLYITLNFNKGRKYAAKFLTVKIHISWIKLQPSHCNNILRWEPDY